MKRVILAACLVLASALAAQSKAGHERLMQAIGTVLADTLPDTTEVTDRLGFVHQVYADSGVLWYQTNELGPGRSPAITIAEGDVSGPTGYLTDDPGHGWTLTVLWLEKTDHGSAVRCRRRALIQPFWTWTMPRDVTPQRRGRQ